MEYLIELLKIVLPAGLVIYGMYLTVISFLSKDRQMKLVELKTKNSATIIPVRLQAGERLCLLLERITPNNLVRRVNDSNYSAGELHHLLLSEVRQEFHHNLSQQVYFSEDTWDSVRKAVEDVLTMINRAAQDTDREAKSIELAKRIFQISLDHQGDSIREALNQVKAEIRIYF